MILWSAVERQVMSAIRKLQPGKKFVNTRLLTDYIDGNRSQYPQFRDLEYEQIKYRVTHALDRMKWKRFTSGARPAVFIDPRVKE